MTSTILLDKLKQVIALSKSFGSLPASEQARALAECANATDEQILGIIQDIEARDQKMIADEDARAIHEKKQIELAMELQKTIKQVTKAKLKYDEAHRTQQDNTALENLEQAFQPDGNQAEKKAQKPTRKKFLGLF